MLYYRVMDEAAELGVQVFTRVVDKLACVQSLCTDLGLGLREVAFMGDDLPDLHVMRAAGLAVAPADAHAWTRESAHWRTSNRGGHGAARELCDLLLAAQGKAEALLAHPGIAEGTRS